MRFYGFFLFLLCLSQISFAEVCLDYWKVGPNGECQKPTYNRQPQPEPVQEEPEKQPLPKKEPEKLMEQPLSQQKNLDQKIDDYLENYEKPPREYAAFHLEPNLENALAWVKKYRETLDRSRKLAEAWTQAEYLYDYMNSQGVDVDSYVELQEELPEVKGFLKDIDDRKTAGLDFEKDKEKGLVPTIEKEDPNAAFRIGGDSEPQAQKSKKSSSEENKQRYNAAKMDQQLLKYLIEAGVDEQQLQFIQNKITGETKTEGQTVESADENRIGGSIGSSVESLRVGGGESDFQKGRIGGAKPKMTIEYFYSANCGFCRKFQPIFKQVLEEQRQNFDIDMDCVDITPSVEAGKKTAEILNCHWRGVTDEEFDAKRIEQTPTLIMSVAGEKNRFEGFVDYNKLSQYFESHK